MALPKYSTDFYDTMTPIWSEQMAKQYNKDMEESLNSTNCKDISDGMKDHINPNHYKDVAYGYQYMDLMIPMLARFEGVEAHLMGQIYKYLMRSKLKDPFVQDLNKAKWYLDKLIKVVSEK